MDSGAALQQVAERFARANPDLANGFAEHAPMGTEALLHLGVDAERAVAWSERHQPHPLPPDANAAQLGAAIREELATDDWRAVAAAHVAVLADRCDAHLFHGLIRTAHAVRALERLDAPALRDELAAGLAAWTAWAGRPRDDQPFDGAFVVSPSIINLHAVTGPMAWALVSPLVDEHTRRRAATSFARSHRRHPAVEATPDPAATLPGPAALASLADHWDAHPAKLAEAALRAHESTEHPVFLAAIRVVAP
jgi:hypothetical protein